MENSVWMSRTKPSRLPAASVAGRKPMPWTRSTFRIKETSQQHSLLGRLSRQPLFWQPPNYSLAVDLHQRSLNRYELLVFGCHPSTNIRAWIHQVEHPCLPSRHCVQFRRPIGQASCTRSRSAFEPAMDHLLRID